MERIMDWVLSLCLLVIFAIIPKSTSLPRPYFSYCTNSTTFAANSTYQKNLNTLLDSLSSKAATSTTGFSFASAGTGTKDAVYGLFLCRGDQNTSLCSECVATVVRDRLRNTNCPWGTFTIIWYEQCMIRYDHKNFGGQMDDSPPFSFWNDQNITGNVDQFREIMGSRTQDLAVQAGKDESGKKYATGVVNFTSFETVYVLEQCTPDLTFNDCYRCLRVAAGYVITAWQGGRTLLPSCYVRYEIYPFFDGATDLSTLRPLSPPPSIDGQDNSRREQMSISLLSIFIVIPTFVTILLAIGIWICRRRRKTMQSTNKDIEDIIAVESLQFDLNTIKVATRNFSLDNKLGEGGFGEVYKGKLPCGQEIAVKRLSKNSGQGIAEFKTEVVLVAKLQHKNLVKLLGFCLGSTEKLLIYEFLTNSSLDRFLFEPTRSILLDWETRFKIILGISRGLLYLHEDSRLKVIHRDLKSSNILLDEAMNPKISDFGLAKLFGMDETQGNTKRIVGTYGYMAPEYAVTGQYSVKSDVFSFGVMVLEIVSGQKNRYCARPQAEETLLHRAWRLWNENNILNLVDPVLENKYMKEEMTKCIRIGLLSIQEDPSQRPRMTSIVAALNGDSIGLPEPKAPQFFGTISEIEGLDTSDSYSCTQNIYGIHTC